MRQLPKPPEVFEHHYLRGTNPRAQSGFAGDEQHWEAARRPIVTAIDRDGSFLDIGCANGYLMESIARWATHAIEPYGLDFAPKLAALARQRLPRWADRIFVGDALCWEPPRRFDFVRTELCYAAPERQPELIERLLEYVVIPGGRLIVCSYGSTRSGRTPEVVGELLRSWSHVPELALREQAPTGGETILQLAVIRASL